MADEVTEPKSYSWNIKKFVERTPCARNSLIYGIVGGFVVGTGYFFKSMHVLRSCRYAVGSFAAISFGSWSLTLLLLMVPNPKLSKFPNLQTGQVCRYVIHKEKEVIKQTVDVLNKSRQHQLEDEDD